MGNGKSLRIGGKVEALPDAGQGVNGKPLPRARAGVG